MEEGGSSLEEGTSILFVEMDLLMWWSQMSIKSLIFSEKDKLRGKSPFLVHFINKLTLREPYPIYLQVRMRPLIDKEWYEFIWELHMFSLELGIKLTIMVTTLWELSLDTNLTNWLTKCEGSLQRGKGKIHTL